MFTFWDMLYINFLVYLFKLTTAPLSFPPSKNVDILINLSLLNEDISVMNRLKWFLVDPRKEFSLEG